MNNLVKEVIDEISEIYVGNNDLKMCEVIEIYKAVQLKAIADTLNDIKGADRNGNA